MVGLTDMVRTLGVLLLLRVADTQVALSLITVRATGVWLKTSKLFDAGTVPPVWYVNGTSNVD